MRKAIKIDEDKMQKSEEYFPAMLSQNAHSVMEEASLTTSE